MDIAETPVTLSILFIILSFSVYGFTKRYSVLQKFSLNPYSIVHNRKYYQIITHIFLHLDTIHLLFNCLTFFFFAPQLEITVGREFLSFLFITSGIISSIPSIIKHKNNPNFYSLGASGAIAGVIFSYILFYPTSRIYMFFIPIGIPAPVFALLYLAYCIYASKYHSSTINHEAHFWGAVWGLICTIILYPEILGNFIQAILLFKK